MRGGGGGGGGGELNSALSWSKDLILHLYKNTHFFISLPNYLHAISESSQVYNVNEY